MAILEAVNLKKSFGGVVAVDNLSFSVEAGQIKSIIGPNGAGKTTVYNLITGLLPPTSGLIRFNGQTITGLKTHTIASLGLARTFQNVRLFENMTVLENVMVGCHQRMGSGLFSAICRLPKFRREEKQTAAVALEKLALVGLADQSQRPAFSLPFAQQRTLEIARALAAEPRMILLDEPAAGLNSHETVQLGKLILKIRQMGLTVLLVEHDMELVMDISEEILVINYGKKIAEGKPAEIQDNQEVIKAYLGEDFKGR